MPGKDLQNELISIAREYAIKMNIIEKNVFKELEVNEDSSFLREYEKKYNTVSHEYCVENKGFSKSDSFIFASPSHFEGIERAVKQKAELKNNDRAEVYFQTDSNIEAEYMFVMLKKDEMWKIENAKRRLSGKDQWDRLIL